jgi:hypothetical protein
MLDFVLDRLAEAVFPSPSSSADSSVVSVVSDDDTEFVVSDDETHESVVSDDTDPDIGGRGFDDLDDEEVALLRYLVLYTALPDVFRVSRDNDGALALRSCFLVHRLRSLLVGYVQSGKSRLMFAAALFLARVLRSNVLVVVRDFVGDADQFLYNFSEFLENIRSLLLEDGHDLHTPDDVVRACYTGKLSRRNGRLQDPEDIRGALMEGDRGAVLVALANKSQLRCVNDLFASLPGEPALTVFIDEVDDTLYGDGERVRALEAVCARAQHTIGVSATVFDPLHDQRFLGSRVWLLEPPADYKGVDRFRMNKIRAMPAAAGNSTRLDRDPELLRVLDSLRTTTLHTAESQHPLIVLLKNERLIRDQMGLLRDIRGRYARDYAVIVHNGQSSLLYARIRPDRDGNIRLPSCHKKARNGRALSYRGRPHEDMTDVHVFKRAPIQDILQLLKKQGGAARFPRIAIVSCDMIGRGINIVSRDFGWHLTHMFYRPSKTTTIPMMLQSMRLCGCYRDNLPLTLYAEEGVLREILTGHRLQEEVVERIRRAAPEKPEEPAVSLLAEEAFHPKKMPKKSLFLPKTRRLRRFAPRISAQEDKGWTLEKFQRPMAFVSAPAPRTAPTDAPAMDTRELNRLTNPTRGMFKKWASPTNQSAIARFMREGLDPNREYTKREMTALCREYKITLSHLLKKYEPHGWAFGRIIVFENDIFRLNDILRESFLENF